MNKKNKKHGKTFLALLLIGVMAVAGISAYFTATDTKKNVIEIGKVSIDLQEPNWEGDTPSTPNKTVPKDPQILNDGNMDAYVYLSVDVPYKNVVTANADGTVNEAADTELFKYTIKEGWIEVSEPKKDTSKGVITHVYAYAKDTSALTVLSPNAKTTALFDTITFANVIENQGLELTNLDVTVKAYGIETSIIGGNTTPENVLTIIINQGSASKQVSEEAGLYDENDKMLLSWTSLREDYDFDIEENDSNLNDILEDELKDLEIKKVIIPDGVEYISSHAFANCTDLTSIEIPDSVIAIGQFAFHKCSNLASITIPKSVTGIFGGAFNDCTSLTSITIPDGVHRIYGSTFAGCTDLTSITIPDTVTFIEDNAFYKCSSLASVTIPQNVTSIGESAFKGCTNLTSIYYKGTATGSPWGATNANIIRE